MCATLTASEVAELVGVSEWSIYASVRNGDCPFPHVKVGRRILFIKGAILRLLEIPNNGFVSLEPLTDPLIESEANGFSST